MSSKTHNAKVIELFPEPSDGVKEFVNIVLTEERLREGVSIVNSGNFIFDSKLLAAFVKWILINVKMECEPELESRNLEWKQVTKLLTDKARVWYGSKL